MFYARALLESRGLVKSVHQVSGEEKKFAEFAISHSHSIVDCGPRLDTELVAIALRYGAAFLNSDCKVVVAPKYWAAHNSEPNLWSTAEIVTPGFTYVDSQGNFFSSDECQKEINSSLSISSKSLIGGLSALASVSQHLSGQCKHKWYLVVFGLVTIKQKLKSRM